MLIILWFYYCILVLPVYNNRYVQHSWSARNPLRGVVPFCLVLNKQNSHASTPACVSCFLTEGVSILLVQLLNLSSYLSNTLFI